VDGPARLRYQPGLDGLRALAVAAVVAFHLEPSVLPGGFLGVDAFFVLSGFLITRLLIAEWHERRAISLVGFWARRARRLLPALFLVIAAIAVYAMVAAPAEDLQRLRGDGLASIFYVANWRFVVTGQSYFDLLTTPSPFRHLWSLAIEEQFYLVWPLVVVACLRARRPRRLLAGVCGVGIATSVAVMALLFRADDPSRAYFGTDTRVHVLLVGALLAVLTWNRAAPVASRRVALALGAGGLAVVVAMAALLDDRAAWFYRGGSLLFALAVAALIVGTVAPGRSPLRTGLSVRPLVALGAISYGVYLWHWPVQIWLTPERAGVDGLARDALIVSVTLAAAWVSYVLVEQPIRRGVLRGWPARVAAPLGIATAVGFLLASTVGAVSPPAYATVAPGTVIEVEGKRVTGSSTTTAPAAAAPSVAPATAPPVTAAPVPPAAPAPPPPARPTKVLLVGDSVAASLVEGLQPAVENQGIGFSATVVPGCSTVGGMVADENDTPLTWTAGCDSVLGAQSDAIAREQPDVVLWLGIWEISHRVVDGQVRRFGTPEGDAALLQQLDAARARLTAGGARLVLLTVAPAAHSDRGDPAATHRERPPHLNALFRELAARHPESVSVVDLAAMLCPTGDPCPEVVDGVRLRPADGTHFGPDGARWAGPRIVDALLAG
jgi:peptidoglycan/LPS O-acetylase OafA/YrhL